MVADSIGGSSDCCLGNSVTYSECEALGGAVCLEPTFREHVGVEQLQKSAGGRGDDPAEDGKF